MARPVPSAHTPHRLQDIPHLRLGLAIVMLFALLYLLVPLQHSYGHVEQAISHANVRLLSAAICCLGLTYIAAAASYVLLSFRSLPFAKTLIVQVSSGALSKMLPSGLASIGLNFLYLRRSRNSAPQAAAAVTANNTLGFIGNTVIIAALLPGWHGVQAARHFSRPYTLVAGGLVLICILALLIRVKRIRKFLQSTARQLGMYRHKITRLVFALGCAVIITLANCAILWLAAAAVGLHLSIPLAVMAASAGVAGGTLVPTPGGLGGVEVGVVAVLKLQGIEPAPALETVILFRLLSYWLPLIAGSGALLYALKKPLV